ncbi:hypothetical protein FIU83_07720 [Halomonas sp. THAF5a]|uniref:hypothetical protein n=1 Tax=Halomonas sp. THAF5a TaxID=2587844 RepID=UPI001267F59A|nr:hypothetical protein [Halomonas sp. THAF5a]QFU01527.1 hypothetical protein FIU83_07720 [Halomonas sp. THAF5a]
MNVSFEHDVLVRQPIDYQLQEVGRASDDEESSIRLRPDVGEEYACFAIWEGGRGREDDIVAELGERFTIVADFLIYWSDQHYRRNVRRLYLRPGESAGKGYDKKIGKPPFRFIIVEDAAPSYTWWKSVSGHIEPTNRNVVREKYRFRSWFDEPYQVHSSNNISEFYFQAVLVLGKPLLNQALSRRSPETVELHRDLEGANGWESWKQLFSVLNVCSDYLVLRKYDDLPLHAGEGDVDFLCGDIQWLASAANVHQNNDRTYKGHVDVAGQRIPVDIRFVGDGYYSASWEKDVLKRKVFHDGKYVPRLDDYFFTLLYHCKVHKESVDKSYEDLLKCLADRMGFDWFESVDVNDDDTIGNLLKGYMVSNSYCYERPIDFGVKANKEVIKIISRVSYNNRKRSSLVRSVKKRVKKYVSIGRSWQRFSMK